MGRERIEIGKLGEKMALKFLEKRGYSIIRKNFRTPFGELDIIAKGKGFTVFIEVKTRTSSSFGPPLFSVTWVKQIHIIKNALFYMKRYGGVSDRWRIDAISVKLNDNWSLECIEHIENAVEDIYQR